MLNCRTRVSDITNSHEGKSIKTVSTAVELASLGVSTIKTVLEDKVKNRSGIAQLVMLLVCHSESNPAIADSCCLMHT